MAFELLITNEPKKNVYIFSQKGNDYDDFPFWLENEEGEGMGICRVELFKLLDNYFKGRF